MYHCLALKTDFLYYDLVICLAILIILTNFLVDSSCFTAVLYCDYLELVLPSYYFKSCTLDSYWIMFILVPTECELFVCCILSYSWIM